MTSARLVWELSRMVLGEADGRVIVLKLAMDESGVHDNSPVLTVAAYVGRPRDWRDWMKHWNIAKRPIKVFHAADAQNLRGEFKGWSEADRDAVVIRLIKVIADSELPGVMIGLHMDEFRKGMADRPELSALFPTAYAACFQWVVQAVLNMGVQAGSRERLGFVHECNNFQHEALTAFNWVKKHANPNGVVMGIQFDGKNDYPPLQAADILAYEGNKRLRDPSRPERRPWQMLNPDGRILAAHYGQENMPELFRRLDMIRDGRAAELSLGSGWNCGARISWPERPA